MLSNHPEQAQIDEMIALTDALDEQRAAGAHALHYGRGMLYGLGRPDLARPLIVRAEAIFRALGDIWPLAMLTVDLGMLAMFAGDLSDAERRFAEA
ncbi:MAG TPA: hypothetical protein VNL77_05770 [Roseiflexaceae bacterium]|nr:hypothetical protein [Roseiflexaceae bacterium]